MAHSTLAVANEFLRRAQRDGKTLTQLQLQKLIYLAHGWNLVVNDSPLIEDEFEAWNYGPVIRRLYNATNFYGRAPIAHLLRWGQDTPFRSDDDGEAIEEFSETETAVIDRVWELYGGFPAFKLSALTHEPGSPWSAAFQKGRNGPVRDDDIKRYFVELTDRPRAAQN